MYLDPHIRTELIRQQQRELARRTLHAPLSSELWNAPGFVDI